MLAIGSSLLVVPYVWVYFIIFLNIYIEIFFPFINLSRSIILIFCVSFSFDVPADRECLA